VLVVHGLWAGDALHAWAEDAHAATSAVRRPGRRPAQPPHPFAAATAEVRHAVGADGGLGLDGAPAPAEGGLTVVLPTRRGLPLASPEVPAGLVRDERRAAVPVVVTAERWRVPSVSLGTGPHLLAALLGTTPTDVIAGAGWRHLAEVAAFADDLAARGRVLPVVVTGVEGRASARWRPVLTREDAAWARALATAAPPSLAAAVPPGTTGPGSDGAPASPGTARDVVGAALDALVDAAVRRRLAPASGSAPGDAASLARPVARAARPTARQAARPVARGAAATATAWMRALRDPVDGGFAATPDEARRLATDLHAWQQDALGRPARARFRLVEPAEILEPVVVVPAAVPGTDGDVSGSGDIGGSGSDASAPWRLEFGLQATREPSVVAAAAEVWA